MVTDLLEIVLRAGVTVIAVVVLMRVNGLRSFSKMSSFEFAITVACGSVIASAVISPKESVFYGLAALAGLFAMQRILSALRVVSPWVKSLMSNQPILLMENGEILHDNLRAARVTQDDLMGKLREANAYDLARVKAVVFEPTGDVSVLHGDPDAKISDAVLEGVKR